MIAGLQLLEGTSSWKFAQQIPTSTKSSGKDASLPHNAYVKLVSFFRFLLFPPARAAFGEYFRRWVPVLKNLISSDVYTMASAISTCAVISFFPFVILLIS